MGKGSELLHLLRTGNSGEARKIIGKIKKQGKKKILAVLNEQDEEGCTALHYCAAYNFLDFIEDFLELGAVVDVEDNKGSTPLHLASSRGQSESVSVLLCRGADPNIVSRTGDTPIHLAAHQGHAEVVEYLIRDHAKCTMLNVSGQNALDLACQNGHAHVVALLLRSGQFNAKLGETPQTSLKLAAKHGHTQVLSILIKHGFDVNRVLPGAHGTCLHEAALYGKIETVHYLLQCGANPSIKNTQGLTALDIVNHYTDPRSAQQLKQLLQDALANQARMRIAQSQYQQSHTQQQGPTLQRVSYTEQTSGQQQGYTQHQQQQGYTQHQQQQGYTQHQQQQSYIQQQKQQSYTQQQQSYTQQQQQVSMQQQQQQPSPKMMGIPLPGNTSMAALIAAKAANRKPMTTSPTRKDMPEEHGVLIRSATLAGNQRPSIDRSLLQKRRNSYSDDSQVQLHYERHNPPTLPRRAHPPTFKPVPPPVSPDPTSQNSRSSSSVDPVIPSITDVKLKKVSDRPKHNPPPQEEPSFENELLAKLKKRQETIDVAPTQNTVEMVNTQTNEIPQEVTPPVQTTPSQIEEKKEKSPSSPSKPPPKPKPKPSAKPKTEEPKPLTWQEEIAKRKALRDEQEKTPSPIHSQQSNTTVVQTAPISNQPIPQPLPKATFPPIDQSQLTPQVKLIVAPPMQPQPVVPPPQPVVQPSPRSIVSPPQPVVPPPQPVVPSPQPVVQPIPQTIVQPPVMKPTPPPEKVIEPSPEREISPAISRVIEEEPYRPSTPSSDQMSRSTSFSSIQSAPLSTVHPQSAFECIPIGDWLISYKLPEYIPALQDAGYDNTDFLLGVSNEELTELGVSKPGHRKRLLTALNQLIAKEHFLTFKPVSVAEWLQQLGLNEYETLMIESGYDDIDFITSVTEEELLEIGINKKGHLKRFKKGIDELTEMVGSEPPTPSPYIQSFTHTLPCSPSHSISNLSSTSQNHDRNSVTETENSNHMESHTINRDITATKPVVRNSRTEEPPLSVSSSQDSGIESTTSNLQSGNFNKMKRMLAKRMGIDRSEVEEDQEESEDDTPVVTKTPVETKSRGPPPIPKRSTSTVLSSSDSPLLKRKQAGKDMIDLPEEVYTPHVSEETTTPPTVKPKPSRLSQGDPTRPKSIDQQYTTEDISSVLDDVVTPPSSVTSHRDSKRSISALPELDELDRALQGFARMEEVATETAKQKELELLAEFEQIVEQQESDDNKTDQLLVDIDNMLADLNTHLDIIIPSEDISD